MNKKLIDLKGNQCEGKQRFASFEEANKQVAHHNYNKRTRKMKSYRCDNCGGYHYGHDKRKKMKHVDNPTYIPNFNNNEVNRGDKNVFLNIKIIK